MVNATKKTVFLAGASLDQIHADPYDFQELRPESREETEGRLEVR